MTSNPGEALAGEAPQVAGIPEAEDQGRAELYRLVALLLAGPPDDTVLAALPRFAADDSALGTAAAALARSAEARGPAAIGEEFNALFIGAPQPMLMPYGSYYAGGQLFGRALAELRIDLSRLGVARAENATEPEDHLAILCEVMSGLIMGAFGRPPLEIGRQAVFFARHLDPWALRFFRDLAAARPADFYADAAELGRVFFELERESFRMV